MRVNVVLIALCLAPGAAVAEPLDCLIEPKSMIELVASEEGRIAAVPAARGDRVQKGDVVVQLDDGVQRLQVEMAKAKLDSDVGIRAQEARLAQRRKELDRARVLEARNVAAATTVEDAEIKVALTALALEEARIARHMAAIEYAQAKRLLERRRITSPVDGLVVSVEAAPGEFANDQLDLMTIAEIHPLHVEVYAPAEYYNRVSVGDVYEVSQVPPLEGRYPATVTIVDPIFDAASATFGVRLEVANPKGDIPAGTRCKVDLDQPLSLPSDDPPATARTRVTPLN